MPPPRRRLLAALCLVLLALGVGAVPASAQDAGSDAPATQTTPPALSPTPEGATETGTTPAPTATAPRAELPDTGLDLRVVALGGVVLLVLGVGLRLRTRPERF